MKSFIVKLNDNVLKNGEGGLFPVKDEIIEGD